MSKFVELLSDDKGRLSSSRFISVYLTIWGTLQISICTFVGIPSLLTGTELSALLMASYGATAMKKPFENGYKPPSKPNADKPKTSSNSKYGGTSYYDNNNTNDNKRDS